MTSIQKRINESLLEHQEERKSRERSGKWSPSTFGACLRKQTFNRQNLEQTNPPDERTLRVFQVGKMFEDFVVTFADVKDLQVLAETDTVKGYADAVKDDEVFEFKSQHSRAFWHSAKKSFDFLKDKHHHALQGAYYALVLGKSQIHFVYVSKDDLAIDEIVIPLTEDLKKEVLGEIKTLDDYWSKGELPPPEARLFGKEKDGTPKECNRYCGWRDYCYKLQGKNVQD